MAREEGSGVQSRKSDLMRNVGSFTWEEMRDMVTDSHRADEKGRQEVFLPVFLQDWISEESQRYHSGQMPAYRVQQLCRTDWGELLVFNAEWQRWENERAQMLAWIERFKEAYAFISGHGRFPEEEEDEGLLRWIYETRVSFSVGGTELFFRDGSVATWQQTVFATYIWGSDDLIADSPYSGNSVRWREMLERLTRYAQKHGHIDVTPEEDRELAYWLTGARAASKAGGLSLWQMTAAKGRGFQRNFTQYNPQSRRSLQQAECKPVPAPRRATDEFLQNIELAARIITEKKAPLLPADGADLNRWFKCVERAVAHKTLSPFEVEALLKAGFYIVKATPIRYQDPDGYICHTGKYSNGQVYRVGYPVELVNTPSLCRWYEMYEKLKQYVTEKNMLPYYEDAPAELCVWFGILDGGVRQDVRNGFLRPHQIKALTDIGIEVTPGGMLLYPHEPPHRTPKRTWEESLDALVQFIDEQGAVPTYKFGPGHLFLWRTATERDSKKGALTEAQKSALLRAGIEIQPDGSFGYSRLIGAVHPALA